MPFPFLALAISAAFSFVGQLLLPKPKGAKPVNDLRFPTATEDRPIPVIWGQVRQDAPNVLWYGDFSTSPIRQRVGLFSKTTVGYQYRANFNLAIGYGPDVRITQILIDDKVAWGGYVGRGQISINSPMLFGDDTRGGFIANIDVYDGSYTQQISPYLSSRLPWGVPAYRGVAHLVFTGLPWGAAYIGNDAEIKPIKIVAQRYPSALAGGQYSNISGDANPIECLYELLINPDWGMGLDPTLFDTASWTAAAQTLYNEGLGFSALWDKSEDLTTTIDMFQRFVNGVVVYNSQTGLFQIKLARPIADTTGLPVYTEEDFIELEYKRMAWSGTINELRLGYRDRTNDYADRVALAQDFANAAIQGEVVAEDLDIQGAATPDVANRIVARELQTSSVPIAKLRARLTRRAFGIAPADVFVFNSAAYGVNAPFRVTKVTLSDFDSNTIEVEAVEDVLDLGYAAYARPPQTGWGGSGNIIPPDRIPQDRFRIPGLPGTFIDSLSDYEKAVLVAPIDNARAAQLVLPDGKPYGEEIAFTPTGTLFGSLGRESDSAVTLNINNIAPPENIPLKGVLLIDNEILAYDSININGSSAQVTARRGAYDTVPAPHANGSTVWITDEWQTFPAVKIQGSKLTAVGIQGQLSPLSSAPTLSVTEDMRPLRPSAPKNFRINNIYNPSSIPQSGDLVLTWSLRDGDSDTPFNEDDGFKDATVRVKLNIHNGATGTLLRTVTGLQTQYIYTNALEVLDNGGTLAPSLIFKLYTEREGATSVDALIWGVSRAAAPAATVTFSPEGTPKPPPVGAAYALGPVPLPTEPPAPGQRLRYDGEIWSYE